MGCWAAIASAAYRRYMRECDVVVQFCLAHLIRDVKFLLTLPGRQGTKPTGSVCGMPCASCSG